MTKGALRERIWDELEKRGEARFPYPPHGRIPNFAGAREAAGRLAETDVFQDADAIKSNPDSPQLPVRRAALRQGTNVYMAVPRLREAECFFRLDPDKIDDLDHSATIGGSSDVGVQITPETMEPIDVIVSGSVAVNHRGSRVGKGEGYSDLEFAILREFGLVDDDTTTATTVHELQVVDEAIPTTDLDVPMDLIVTPDRTIRTDTTGTKPSGIAWEALDKKRLKEIPILQRLE